MTDVERAAEFRQSFTRGYLVDAAVIAVAAVLIFTRLGVYPFWGDEADVVIYARSIWETGDMHPWYGDNLYAYRDGAQLHHLKNRSAPPLPFYLAAPFWGINGPDAFWLRTPFALCGVGVVALMQWAWRRLGFPPAQRALLGLSLACNTSFILYSRQCRYYDLALLLATALVALYATFNGSRRRLAALVAVASLLIATQFMNFAALIAALLVDYAVWQRAVRKLSLSQWLALLVPLGLVFAAMVYVFNPLRSDLYPSPENRNFFYERWVLIKWSLRDMNRCEYGVGSLWMVAPLVGLYVGVRRGEWLLLRLVVGSAVFLVATVCLMPQPIEWTRESDVRYLMPLIVPGTAVGVLIIFMLTSSRIPLAGAFVAAAVLSNMLHVPWRPEVWRSSPFDFACELREPRRPASAVVGEWLRANVPAGRWCAVVPTDWLAPHLISAPHLHYGWQLDTPADVAGFADEDPRMFEYRAPVDVIVLHGFSNLRETFEKEVVPVLRERGQSYELWAKLDTYFDDRTRPELIWHWFREQAYDNEMHAVYVYRRMPSPTDLP